MADGSVIIKVDADEKAAVKKLHQVEREIDKLREKLSEKQSGKSLLVQESERLQAEISRLRQAAKAENLKWQGGDVAAGQRESELLAKIPALKTQMEKVNAEIDKYNDVAKALMDKLGVAVNDLNSITKTFDDSLRSDWVHYGKEGSKILAEAVVKKIQEIW